MELFTVGLQEPLRTDMELQAPQSLEVAMSLARAYERRLQLTTPTALHNRLRDKRRCV